MDRPSPPDPPTTAHEPDRAYTERVHAADQLAQRVHELEQALADARGTAERERAAREGAERLAADRAAHVEDLRNTLRMLTAGTPPTSPPAPPSAPVATEPVRGPLERLSRRLGL